MHEELFLRRISSKFQVRTYTAEFSLHMKFSNKKVSIFKFTFFNTRVCVSVCMEQLGSGRWIILKFYTGGGRGY